MKCATQMMCLAAIVAAMGSAAMAVDIETVPVGNANNTADTRYDASGYGGVDYEYNIGKYEVTAGQYRDFLNAVAATDTHGLYNSSMNSSGSGCQITQLGSSGSYTYDFSGRPVGSEGSWMNRPVNYVSYWDACRFANWLHNGQGAGDTETGVYALNGATNPSNSSITRNSDWKWAVTSEDEWYKAAYYTTDLDQDGTHDDPGYYNYPTGSNTMPSNNLDGSGNNATFYYTVGDPYYRTWGGAHSWSGSPYGTFDQGGNVWEWNETIIGSSRGLRGGSFYDGGGSALHASYRLNYTPAGEGHDFGFRVSEVPEPATMAILMLGGIGILRRRKCVRR